MRDSMEARDCFLFLKNQGTLDYAHHNNQARREP